MVLQDVVSLKWRVKRVIMEGRTSEDGTVRSYALNRESGREILRNAKHIKLAAIRGNKKVTFAENFIDEAKTDDEADSEYEANTESAESDRMATENGSETIRNARHIKFAAIKENTKVRFAENLIDEAKSDDEANTESAESDSMETDTRNEAINLIGVVQQEQVLGWLGDWQSNRG